MWRHNLRGGRSGLVLAYRPPRVPRCLPTAGPRSSRAPQAPSSTTSGPSARLPDRGRRSLPQAPPLPLAVARASPRRPTARSGSLAVNRAAVGAYVLRVFIYGRVRSPPYAKKKGRAGVIEGTEVSTVFVYCASPAHAKRFGLFLRLMQRARELRSSRAAQALSTTSGPSARLPDRGQKSPPAAPSLPFSEEAASQRRPTARSGSIAATVRRICPV